MERKCSNCSHFIADYSQMGPGVCAALSTAGDDITQEELGDNRAADMDTTFYCTGEFSCAEFITEEDYYKELKELTAGSKEVPVNADHKEEDKAGTNSEPDKVLGIAGMVFGFFIDEYPADWQYKLLGIAKHSFERKINYNYFYKTLHVFVACQYIIEVWGRPVAHKFLKYIEDEFAKKGSIDIEDFYEEHMQEMLKIYTDATKNNDTTDPLFLVTSSFVKKITKDSTVAHRLYTGYLRIRDIKINPLVDLYTK